MKRLVLLLVCLLAGGGTGAGAQGGEGDNAAISMCPGVVYPAADMVLGEEDPMHVTVMVQDCRETVTGARLSVLVNSEIISEYILDSPETTHSFFLSSINVGSNLIEARLRLAGQSQQTSRATRTQFSISWEAFLSSYLDAVLAYEPEHPQDWPFKVDGSPFLQRHALLAHLRPQLKIEFPTPGYVFKKMNLGPTNFGPFLRLNKESLNPGCALALSVNGGEWRW